MVVVAAARRLVVAAVVKPNPSPEVGLLLAAPLMPHPQLALQSVSLVLKTPAVPAYPSRPSW